jgi:hypothetical protein
MPRDPTEQNLTSHSQINTKKVELDYFGAPLSGNLDHSIYSIPAPLDQ